MALGLADKNGMAAIGLAALVSALPMLPLFPDTMKTDFSSCYVKDFACFSEAHHMTPEKQAKMLDRRIGTYAADIPGDGSGFAVGGKKLVRLFVDISSNCIAKLFFEDESGSFVSSDCFLSGRLSDTSIYWGHPERGVSAKYGVMRDMMPLLISPHGRQMPLMLKRVEGRMDAREIRLEETVHPMHAICDNAGGDIFAKVCEDAAGAEESRRCAPGGEAPATNRMVACYEERSCFRAESGTWVCTGKPNRRRFHVLMSSGGYHTFVDDGNCDFTIEPYYKSAWWDEFRNTFPCGDGCYYKVSGDTIAVTSTCFGDLSILDSMIISPRLCQKTQMGDRLTADRYIEAKVDELTREPEKFFTRRVCERIANVPENGELRRKLSSAYLDFMQGKRPWPEAADQLRQGSRPGSCSVRTDENGWISGMLVKPLGSHDGSERIR